MPFPSDPVSAVAVSVNITDIVGQRWDEALQSVCALRPPKTDHSALTHIHQWVHQ